jgi:hypothetical protein
MVVKAETIVWKKVFQVALNRLRDDGLLPADFVGRITLNINAGGIAVIDCSMTIR